MNQSDKTTSSSAKAQQRSACPISSFLDILGDKWSLLVVRDLFIGLTTYSDFQSGPEKIPTNILADRLKRLQQHQIIAKQKYQEHPARYHYILTEKGQQLGPVIQAMLNWSQQHVNHVLDNQQIKQVKSQRLKARKVPIDDN